MKSLSKGNNLKKDILPPTLNLKESTTVPLSSVLPTGSTFEDDITDTWPEQVEREDFDASEEPYEQQAKPLWKKNGKQDPYNISMAEGKFRRPNGQTNWKDLPKVDSRNSHSDDDLNALLQVNTCRECLFLIWKTNKIHLAQWCVNYLIRCNALWGHDRYNYIRII